MLVFAGCASTPSPATTPPPQPRPAAVTTTASEPGPATAPLPPAPRGELEHGMRNCPTALVGATTVSTNTAMGVDLTITTTEPAVRRQIIALARLHGHMGEPDGSAMAHTGLHGGPASFGHCPVVHASTNVTFTPLPNGAVIHVNAIVPEDVLTVQATVADRVARLAAR